jgi:hypothetical protein
MKTLILLFVLAPLTLLGSEAPRGLQSAKERGKEPSKKFEKTEGVSALDHGPKPIQYQRIVKAYLANRLRDENSAQYQFQEPFKGYTRKAPLAGGGIENVGWVVCVRVNAKNGFGGYTGWKTWRFVIRNNELIAEIYGNIFDKEPWLKRLSAAENPYY